MDVKVEGKGVVRFLDPTLHNGNTFNTSFISDGSTGLAYGDDTECTACGSPCCVWMRPSRLFYRGNMVGACICKCLLGPKLLVACSGKTAPGFQEAVASTPFKVVEGFQASERQPPQSLGQ